MIAKRVVIAALARDCNDSLVRNIPRIEELRTYFSSSEVVVVENDSKDGTKETLMQWAQKSKGINLIMNDFGTVTIPLSSTQNPNPSTSMSRIEKMARYRNLYMDFVRHMSVHPDYLIIIDVDVKSFSVKGLIKSIESAPNDWGAVFAFGLEYFEVFNIKIKKLMYDMFAYIHKDIPKTYTVDYMFNQKRIIVKRVKKELFSKCASAFGGVAVYKWNLIEGLNYQAIKNEDKIITVLCEHIPLNLNLNQTSSLYISRYLIVDYGKCPTKIGLRMIMPEWLFKILNKINKTIK